MEVLDNIKSQGGIMYSVLRDPQTGKTTIAKYLGEIYHGIGVLSKGHVVVTERSKLVGRFIGDAEQNTLDALQRASGGILFIDEAYTLFVKADDTKDYGLRVIETLLSFCHRPLRREDPFRKTDDEDDVEFQSFCGMDRHQ